MFCESISKADNPNPLSEVFFLQRTTIFSFSEGAGDFLRSVIPFYYVDLRSIKVDKKGIGD